MDSGDHAALPRMGADLALMTGNVAQIFLDDADWEATLRSLHAALRPGGQLAFESRHPQARAWEGWTREATHERLETPAGPLECWAEVQAVTGEQVRFVGHNIFGTTGEHLRVTSTLRFRTQAALEQSLRQAGFEVRSVYGDWQRGELTPDSRVMVFVAWRL